MTGVLPGRALSEQPTGPDPEVWAALQIARDLIAAGVPVFAARPAMRDGVWQPDGGTGGSGYWLPQHWQRTVPTPAWLDPAAVGFADRAWRPGWGLAAVTGHGVDLVDVDPRHGGDATRAALLAASLWPRAWGVSATPSGGRHEFVAPLGVRSRDAVRPGLDIKAGLPDGTGRGFAWLPPTVRLSKTTSAVEPYRWLVEPDLAALADTDDDTGQGLADLVALARVGEGAAAEQTAAADAASFLQPSPWPHDGPIPAGHRHARIVSYAGSLRRRDVHFDEAEHLMHRRWQECEQPAGALLPWPEARATLADIYRRYAPAAVPAVVEAGQPAEAGEDAEEQALRFARAVSEEAGRLRVRAAAQRLVRQDRARVQEEPDAVPLRAFLAVPDEPERYRVQGLWPVGGRALLAAQYKAGKTTLIANLVRALVDGEPFLDAFPVTPPEGRVVIIDDELDERMLRRWLREQGVVNLDAVAVLPLRGRVGTFDLLDDDTRARWAAKLRAHDAGVVMLDCLRPVLDALSLSEDKEAGRFLVHFDALLAEAGAGEGVVVHHMGHSGERSRGDSRLRDWPDVEWRLVRAQPGEDGEQQADAPVYFAAYGRDVNVPESLLDYAADSRRLTLTGGSRAQTAADQLIPDVLAYLADNAGASQRAVETALSTYPRLSVRTALRRAMSKGLVDSAPGPRRATLHFLALRPTTASSPNTSSAPSAP